jgi:hypothetical protein
MGDTAEYKTLFDPGNGQPLIRGSLYPVGHWNRAHLATLIEQVKNGPVIVPLLNVRQLQPNQLSTPQAAAQQESQDRMISFAFCVYLSGASRSLRPCAQVSKFPSWEPSFFAPFTRLILAARSGLSRPLSEAS